MPPLGLEPRTYGLCSIAPASEFPGGCSDVTLASTPMLVAQSGRPASTDETAPFDGGSRLLIASSAANAGGSGWSSGTLSSGR